MNIPILDTHQHLIYPRKYPYSWTNGLAPLEGNAFHLKDYLTAIQDSGINRTIFNLSCDLSKTRSFCTILGIS